ncbi:glutamate-cysteine ligase catalytic subunit [Sistotremastrum suecicum HHB10207 ss-3]|uniref:Glutamate--cysteine ligase n=1 Tax=Sistotremastrum suecicum HHB10207 ss-3 TaxID=1314776 RepID=A0A166H9R1_9AGAM|nr:glutamate-cysteine ligase catalytic subunit [Sistotremastrum suecicum HHB10207 ss-3]
MGLLYLGTPLSWDQAKPHADAIREHGITQFLNIWHRLKDRQGDELLWGDEVEYMVVSFDHDAGAARLSLRQTDILAKLAQLVNDICIESPFRTDMPTFHPEYGRFMLESTPGSPYTGSLPDLLSVEKSMRYRRTLARSHLKPNEVPITLPVFPRLGVPGVFTDPYYDPANAKASHSLFLPDEITNPHVRFPTITANTRERRGSKVAMNLPLFFDTNTPRPFIDPTIPWDRNIYKEDPEAKNGAALPDHIYMDAMGFGMGCSCLQITFQACNIAEARRVYDALVPIGPIMLALTAASPAWRGYLSDVDCRWNVIAGSVDDRTEEERGIKPLSENKYVIPKSRYDSVDSYISTDWINRPEYNDNPLPIDEKTYQRLRDNGLDDLLAKHIAHLFIRDPLIVFSETLDWNDETSSDHFEGIQSTNWQTLRFKPPPAGSPIGWRVEFRSMEISLTDFENAAFSIFIVLLSRAILSFGLNFYVPMSKVDANMQRAQKRNAAREGTFFFRNSVFPVGSERRYTTTAPVTPPDLPNGCGPSINKENKLRNCYPEVPPPADPEKLRVPIEEEYEEMTIDEIINGKGNDFPGLLGLVHAYLNSLDVDFPIKRKLRKYLALIEQRADGTLMTAATWQREFIRSHPDYKFDSVVSESINYDLLKAADEIERGLRPAPGFLPSHYTGTEEDTGEPGP